MTRLVENCPERVERGKGHSTPPVFGTSHSIRVLLGHHLAYEFGFMYLVPVCSRMQ